MVPTTKKNLTSDLTALPQGGLAPEALAHLERDRWPEFERELRLRRPRRIRFDLCTWYGERPRWGWLIPRCRKWDEIERVLNRHRVDYHWKHRRAVIAFEDSEVYRLS